MSPREIAGKVSPSVVTIRGKGKMGSGFVVRADGWSATNAHVVEKEEHVEIVLADGRTSTISDAVAVDEEKDLAILLNFAVPARYLIEMLKQPHAKRLIEVTMAK